MAFVIFIPPVDRRRSASTSSHNCPRSTRKLRTNTRVLAEIPAENRNVRRLHIPIDPGHLLQNPSSAPLIFALITFFPSVQRISEPYLSILTLTIPSKLSQQNIGNTEQNPTRSKEQRMRAYRKERRQVREQSLIFLSKTVPQPARN